MPDRDARPRTAVCQLTPYQVAPFPRGVRPSLEHAFESLLHIARSPIRQSRDNRAGREHLRIRSEHRGRHRAAGGEARNENLAAVDAVRTDRLLDHLADRERLAAAPRRVPRQKPVEAGLGIVGLRLFRQQQDKTVSLSERRPSRAEIVACGRLRAAVQNHDQRWRRAELLGNVTEHPQRAGIRSEARQLGEVIGSGRRLCWARSRGCRMEQRRPVAAIARQLRDRLSEFAHTLLLVPVIGPTRCLRIGCCIAVFNAAMQHIGGMPKIANAKPGSTK